MFSFINTFDKSFAILYKFFPAYLNETIVISITLGLEFREKKPKLILMYFSSCVDRCFTLNTVVNNKISTFTFDCVKIFTVLQYKFLNSLAYAGKQE